MICYAFQNQKTGELLAGTDYRYNPHHQIKASDVGSAPLLFTEFQKHYGIIDTNIIHRQISKRNWKLVKEKVEVIE